VKPGREPKQLTWEICILAGGLSVRMGRDKARLPLGRRTMLGQIKVVARRAVRRVRIIRRDLVKRCGPLGGVYTALRTTRKDAVLFLACDMPFVGNDLLERLAVEFLSAPKALFVSYRGQACFPFILPRLALPAVVCQIAAGDFSLQGLARALAARRIRVPRLLVRQLRNVNTPREWAAARRAWSKRA